MANSHACRNNGSIATMDEDKRRSPNRAGNNNSEDEMEENNRERGIGEKEGGSRHIGDRNKEEEEEGMI